MTAVFNRFFLIALISVLLSLPLSVTGEGVTSEKVLGLENVIITCYALGGDTSDQKAFREDIYLAKGAPNQAIAALKEIINEGRKPVWSFKMKDQIEVIIFRGAFLTLCKIGIKKVALKDSSIEVYAEYSDFPDCSVASQPAAIIPVGKLPPGKYDVTLFVDSKLRKKIEFKVLR